MPAAADRADEIAAKIIERANAGYRTIMKGSGYPPFALTPWDDRIKWSAYIQRVAADVLREELAR
jgi:hypothetical protein